jgi:predicted nucleic acid-binding protein
MSAFADSSALVKRYADEPGHEQIRGLEAVAVSQLARVEVPAALWRKHRLGELTADHARLLTADFEADYFGSDKEPPQLAAVMITGRVLDDAARLCAVHGLRAYDGVQLSSAMAARRADPDCTTLAAFDHDLRRAAATEAFTLLPGD